MNSVLTSLGITNSRTRPQNTQMKSNSATSIKSDMVKKSASAATVHISEEAQILLQSEENYIHNPTEYEIAKHNGDMKNKNPQTRQFSHTINIGTEENPNVTGSPTQVLNALVFNISMAFGEISDQSGTNNSALENAFRNMVLSLFDDAAMSLHGQTEDPHILAGLRTDAKHMGNTFVNSFFSEMSNITSQNLRDTGMERAELAFHYAMNYTFFEKGLDVLGGTSAATGSESPIDLQTDEESRRATMEFMSQAMRENSEVLRERAKMFAEEAEKRRMIMLIFSRISSGATVPQKDIDFLKKNSPGMYVLAMSNRAMAENNDREYESVTKNRREHKEGASSVIKHDLPSNVSTPPATENVTITP